MKYAYKVKTLYDGTKDEPKESQILLVHKDKIESVVPWSEENNLKNEGYQIIDYSNYFTMPGMIDGHVHLVLPGDGTLAEDFLGTKSYGEVLLTAAKNAYTALQSGITVLRDCGGIPDVLFNLRKSINDGIIPGPDLILCGSSLTTTGGHTHFFEGEVDTVDETVVKIRKLHKRGADFVKLIATGGGTRNVIQYAQMLSYEQMKAASEEAHRLGKICTAHVCTTETARTAVESGVDMIEHLIWADKNNNLEMDFELAEKISKKDIPTCITLSVLPVSIARLENLGRSLTESEQAEYDMLCRFRDTIFEGFRLTYKNMRYIPGTDAGWRNSKFDSLFECIKPMSEIGLGNLGALYSATGLAASVLKIDNMVGTLSNGKQADFILLEKSPLDSIDNLKNVKIVYKKGKCVKLM